ncbi:PREDICTED: LOW QUALITY PROTEIN: stereocilin-like, partial [Cyprinodon variegatus]|uniref:LOW QUALITY PROTEIN: stereocilin-like n=1 Tax=Cyprinodon variegatus TaxID=28743 RepID=UPI000742745B
MAAFKFTSIIVCIVLLGHGTPESTASTKEDHRDDLLKGIISKWKKEAGVPPQPETNKDQSLPTWVRGIVGGLKTLFPTKNLPSLNKPIDRHRLSGFLYNISLYLQEMGAELEDVPPEQEEEQLWEKVLHFFLQSEGNAALNQWNGRVPPRPSIKMQDWFLSLRGSPHWDWLLGLLQSLITLSERQPHRPILTFLSQNWRTLSAVLEAAFQALISGTYGQASAGRSGAGDRSGQQAQKNLALVQSLDGLRRGLLHRVGSSVYGNLRKKVSRVTMALLDDVSSLVEVPQPNFQGRCTVGNLRQLILWGIRHNVLWNTQALGVSSQGLPSSLPFLSCPSTQGEKLQSPRPAAQSSSKKAPSSQSSFKQKQSPKSSAAGARQFTERNSKQKEIEFFASTEILEAACNESIPGLTGVSNFTVFLYCKLFEGENGSGNPAATHLELDLHATCLDAAWYLSAAEQDFFWVHVCTEFFAHEFNNTVCSNSSFWLQKAQQAAASQDFHFFNQTSIEDLCVQLSGDPKVTPELSEDCLAQLGGRLLSADAFRNCFLPNNSFLISALCGSGSAGSQQALEEGSWAAAYCSKIGNLTLYEAALEDSEPCQYTEWTLDDFTNFTLLEFCGQTQGLREHMCLNSTVFQQLVELTPQFIDVCADLRAQQESNKCLLQRIFDMLPARYEFDTSQLCVEPAPMLMDLMHKISVCEMDVGEREGFFVALGYVLRILDFVVGLSSGLDEGEREARQGLGQAILLSSLLDNSSWATLQPEASTSVLHTVGVFLRREQNATVKEDLLSCFSPVLWDLIQQNGNSSALRVLLQEYLQMPKDSIRSVVMSAEKEAVKRFISHMHQSWDQLQVETSQASQQELQAMETMTAAFIHKFPRVTPELFVDLSQFIPFMSVSDIMNFPASLIVNDSVLTAIRDHSSKMKPLQKKAFVKRLLQSNVVGDVPTWHPHFLSSILPLLPYLPVHLFQQLTSQQLSPLVELISNSSLDGVRGRHVLRTLFSKRKNLTGDNLLRLGGLVCYLDPAELGINLQDPAVSSALWQQLSQCISKGLISASGRLSSWLIPAVSTSLNISSMTSAELSALSGLLPQLGASFLLSLPSQRLLEILSKPGIHRYSPAQAFQVLSKITKDSNLTVENLCRLKPLLSGLFPAVLRNLHWSDFSEEHCPCWRTLQTDLKPGHRAMLFNAMQEALHKDSRNFTQQANCLLPFVPLRKLIQAMNGGTIWRGISAYRDIQWSSQQTQFLFRQIHEFKNVTIKMVKQKCIVDELRKQPELELSFLSSGFAATLPVTMVDNLSNASIRGILSHIQLEFLDFLRLPHYKQTKLAEKALSELDSSLAEEKIDGAVLDVLGPLLPFLDRDSLALVDRGALALRLEEMRSFCLPKEALRDISDLLTRTDLLGDPSKWQVGDIEHLGRLVFGLSTKQIDSIPLTVLNQSTVEQVLVSQKFWEKSLVGGICMSRCVDQQYHRKQTWSLIRGIVKARSRRAKVPAPSCADIRGTFPSAWTPTQLRRMSVDQLKDCVEVFGQNPSLSSKQRRALWGKLRQSFSPVRELRVDQVLALGSVVTEMGDRELQDASLTDLGVLAHLGTLTNWAPRKMRAVVLSVMRKSRLKVEHLTVVDLATLGHLICGLQASEIKRLSPYNLSVAVMFLREMTLPCTEQQMEALTNCLARAEAFGPVSAWGPEIFTEIGTLAAGLPDIVLSALLREQMEGITPEAVALMSPKKIAVVFSAEQLSWLSVEQAWAVTEEQWAELNAEQRHAVDLARYEGDVLMELRGGAAAALLFREEPLFSASSMILTYFLGLVPTTQRRFAVSSSDLTPPRETISHRIEQDVKEA